MQKASDDTVIATYQYNVMWRRTVKTNSTETLHYYYNSAWRSVEEQIVRTGGALVIEQQHLWGVHNRWEYQKYRDYDPQRDEFTDDALKDELANAMAFTEKQCARCCRTVTIRVISTQEPGLYASLVKAISALKEGANKQGMGQPGLGGSMPVYFHWDKKPCTEILSKKLKWLRSE